jgi:hypothetical protein
MLATIIIQSLYKINYLIFSNKKLHSKKTFNNMKKYIIFIVLLLLISCKSASVTESELEIPPILLEDK